MRFSRLVAAGTIAAISLLGASAAGAKPAPAPVSGTIGLATVPSSYGDTVSFDAIVSGKTAARSSEYITVVCSQTTVVYQASGPLTGSFTLVDQAGDNLNWDGGSASCEAWLIYSVPAGKGVTLSYLAFVDFSVSGSATFAAVRVQSSGSCVVNPNPVAVGATWTLTGSNLGASAIVNVLVTDAAGSVTAWNSQADSTGTISDEWHSYATGQSDVRILESVHHKTVTVATCSFIVTS